MWKKLRVGVDLDGVCYDFNAALEGWLRQTGREARERYNFGPSTRWEFYLDWGMTLDEFIHHCNMGVNAGYIFKIGEVLNDAVAQLKRIRDAGHEIVLITDRSFGAANMSENNTYGWLANTRLPHDEIYFTADKSSVNVDFMIDDKPANVIAMAKEGTTAYLLDAGWNQDFKWGMRVNTLKEYVDAVLGKVSYNGNSSSLVAPPVVETGEEVITISSTGGHKAKKLAQFSLIPEDIMWELAELYGKGAEKYEPRNWEDGYPFSLSYDSARRHMALFWQGEDYDVHKPDCPEDCTTHTGMPHLICAIFHLAALRRFSKEYPQHDNRPKHGLVER